MYKIVILPPKFQTHKMNTDSFALRHIGPRRRDLPEMLKTIGAETLDQLIFETVPDDIIMKKDLDLDVAMTEQEYLEHITEMAEKNKVFKTYIGLGYYPTNIPAGHSAKYIRKSGLVYGLYTIPSRNSTRPFRSATQFPNHG